MRTLIVGYGSIGSRHARILAAEGHDVALVTKRTDAPHPTFDRLETALEKFTPEYVVISGFTSEHAAALHVLCHKNYPGRVLVEKPIAQTTNELPTQLPHNKFYVGYNLRFHPLLQRLRELLGVEKVSLINVYCGSYLPDWRPDDYRKTSSALKERGGGALRVLSHEIDYSFWLSGPPAHIMGHFDRVSKLEIDCEDSATICWKTFSGTQVNIQINFLDHLHQRNITVITENETYQLDILRHTLKSTKWEDAAQLERDDTYRRMHKAIIQDDKTACTWADGLQTMKIIEAVERYSQSNHWQTYK